MRTLIVAMGLAAFAAAPAQAQTLPSNSVGREAVLTAPASTAGASSTVAGGGTGFGTNTATPDTSATRNSPAGNVLPGTAGIVGTGTVTLVPEGTVSVIGSTGERVVGIPASGAQPAPAIAASDTPLFDQAARDARAREQARRARGEEPRVFGIAPNTEADLTWQMPDDRIIRY